MVKKRKNIITPSDENVPLELPQGVKLLHTLRGHRGWIGRIAWSQNGRILASPSRDKTIKLWDGETGMLLNTLTGHTDDVVAVNFNPIDQTLLSGGEKICKLWDVPSGKLLRTWNGDRHELWSLVIAPNGRITAGAGTEGHVKLWEIPSGKLLREFGPPGTQGSCITSLSFDGSGQTIISGHQDSKVYIWDASSGRLLRTLEGHRGLVLAVANNLKNQLVATASEDKIINLWEIESGKLLRTLEGHTDGVKGLAFSHDGRLLASKGMMSDDSIRLWNPRTGFCVATIPEPTARFLVGGIAFHPEQPILATVGSDPDTLEHTTNAEDSSRDRVIHIWKLDLDFLLKKRTKFTISYTSAKVVLVGESNVGKSYLAHRIATGHCPKKGAIKSTHGMKFWPIDPARLGQLPNAPEYKRRDVVLWDMGGQDEYRLVHQLFLHDTTIALILCDPTRGNAAFKEVETWNKYLEKQLRGRRAVKFLVGAKLDEPSLTIDHQGLHRLIGEGGFAGYFPTSAIRGTGITELCKAISKAIDWENLAATSRPELFQRIRDEIETRRKKGEVVLKVADLHRALNLQSTTRDETAAVDAVTEQLASQGIIARSRVATGEPVLVLQVQEIERYAGSLIVAARNNPRGVPALELRTIAQSEFELPGIATEARLPRHQEQTVIECTAQLLLEHGVCFQHEGLLVFPTLFAPAPVGLEAFLPHGVSLYYDFSGAIDNIYASLVAWLVLARNFGRVRLWADRAEFELADKGLCGLRKVGRVGGFAHVDVYFEPTTPQERQELFISFVEEHLRQHGVEIREHVSVICDCSHKFDEETLRKRIARGEKDVGCPVCEMRHNLAEGASEFRQRNPELLQLTWALKTEIEERRQKSTEQAVKVIENTVQKQPKKGPIRLLHLSDLHFTAETLVEARLQALVDDIKRGDCLGIEKVDFVVISGDFTDKGHNEGFEKAYDFVSGLIKELELSAERCVFVPGNHDVKDIPEAFENREGADGKIVKVRSPHYIERFKPFSDGFYHKFFVGKPYPLTWSEQGMCTPFWEEGIQFITLNSCWQIDEFNRKRSGLYPDAVAHALKESQKQEKEARTLEQIKGSLLRIAVWHHAVTGPEQMSNVDFLGHLQNHGVKIGLHGDVHEVRRSQIEPWRSDKKLFIAGAGSFGAHADQRPESTPRLYNLLEINRDLKSARVHTRQQSKPDGAWRGWNEWPRPKKGHGGVPYYEIKWK
ncbi:MAG: hypothetical protein JWQ71_3822 [Pedosphaera sp.]|nr:hypothetical protein [Pedosphaera sp.]